MQRPIKSDSCRDGYCIESDYIAILKASVVFTQIVLTGADPGGVDWVASHPPFFA